MFLSINRHFLINFAELFKFTKFTGINKCI